MSKTTLPFYASRRVCIILHQLGWGGVDRVATILSRGFVEHGISTELLVCVRGGPGEEELKKILGDHVSIRFFGDASGNRALDLIRNFTKLGRYLCSKKPDVVLSAGNNVSLFSMFSVLFYCTSRTSLFIKTTNPVIRPYEKPVKRYFRWLWYTFIFKYCDGVLTLTESESTKLLESFPYLRGKLVTVSNPYITDSHMPFEKRGHELNVCQTKLIVSVGRLHRQKRYDVLLRAFAKVSKNHDCRLVILGEGEDRQSLNHLAIELGITHLVEMPGFVANVQDWLTKADLFVLSSDYEGLPAVVLEALAHNCPVVTTDCFPGARELLDNAPKCGVGPIRNPDLLAIAIIESLRNNNATPSLYLRAAPYQVESAIKSHLTAINEIMTQKQLLLASNKA